MQGRYPSSKTRRRASVPCHVMNSNTLNCSLRTDTQLRFTLHLTPLGVRFCLLVSQPVAYPVLETNNLGDNKKNIGKSNHLLDFYKHLHFNDQDVKLKSNNSDQLFTLHIHEVHF